MTARQQAILDIKDELRKSGKCLLAFRSDLNPIMRNLVEEYITLQKGVHNG